MNKQPRHSAALSLSIADRRRRNQSIMQYGGASNHQQRILNMMMQARNQPPQGGHQQPLYSSFPLPPPVTEPTFVTSLTENDVLLGRGTPCAENEGNVRFRRLVKQRKVEYIAAEKRMRKDAIAREILEVIASRGGKFLRKVESQAELEQLGVPPGYHAKEVWAIVDEDTQVQKVKQALRNKDDAAELIASANNKAGTNEEHSSKKYGEHDITNRFPRGVMDESNIHKADCTLQFGTGMLERASSHSSNEEKAGSPKLKSGKAMDKTLKSPGSSSKTNKMSRMMDNLPRRFDMGDADLMAGGRRGSAALAMDPLAGTTPTNRRNLLAAGRLDPTMAGLGAPPSNMMRRQLWDKSQAAPSERELRSLQELQRLRLMREQMGAAGPPPSMMNAGLGVGLGPSGLDAGPYGGTMDPQLMMNAEYRQMQAAQQQAQMQQAAQMQHMAAAREQAAMAASFQRSSFSAGMGGAGPAMHPSAALAARQLQMENQVTRRTSLTSACQEQQAAVDAPAAYAGAGVVPRATRSGADSAGERAIGIAQAMKRAEAFSPTESLEMSHLETLILSVLCSHGLPVWTPEAHTKSFVTLPTFAKRLDWTWYGFASVLKQKANSSHLKGNDGGRVEELTLESTMEYQRDPRELATKTIMLMEKLRRHCDTAGSSSQRKHPSLGMRVPLWLDRELSRWAMTLDIADPTGRPVPFSSTDFVAEHVEYKDDPAVLATAAFDPPLADDVVEQVALLTRLRSVFVKTKGREIRSKLEAAVQKASEGWEDQPKGWDVEPLGTRDLLLCDRLLSDGFSGVLTNDRELGNEYGVGSSPRGFPSFESLGLAKSSIQQRANQIARELHVMEEQKDLNSLRLDRMERLAQSVLSSQQSPPTGFGGSEGALQLLAGATSPKKRKGSITSSGSRSGSPAEGVGAAKKQKTSKQ